MATGTLDRRAVGRICGVCKENPSMLRSTLVEPLVSAVTTFVCLDCDMVNEAAVEALIAENPRLVHHVICA